MTDAWTATAEKAAERARTLRPIAITLFAIGMAMIANDVVPVSRECFDVLIDGQRQFSALCVLQKVGAATLPGPGRRSPWSGAVGGPVLSEARRGRRGLGAGDDEAVRASASA